MNHALLLSKIRSRNASLTILGLGHVGLPTALVFASAGFTVTGVDLDHRKVESLRKGKSYILEPGLEQMLNRCLRNRTFKVTDDSSNSISRSDFVSICVPTPVANMVPDLGYFNAALHAVKAGAHRNMMILFESTVPPSTVSKFASREMQTLGFHIDEDIFMAYCPERLAPGRSLKEFVENTRIVGSIGPRSGEIAAELYGTVCKNVVVTDCLTAELAKVAENTFRDINIAYANLVALIAERHGADVDEVIKLANTHPRVGIHRPGLGVGGPCLPKDPFMLIQAVPDEISQLVRSGRKLNESMAGHTVDVIARTLNERRVDIVRAKVAVLGVSYKPETEDVTNSPAKLIIEELTKRGASVVAYDPYAAESFGAEKAPNLENALQNSDCVIIVTAHDVFRSLDPSKIAGLVTRHCVVFDGPRILDAKAVKDVGLTYLGTGYGVGRRSPQ